MSTLTLEPTLFDRPGGEPSLDELISGVWEVSPPVSRSDARYAEGRWSRRGALASDRRTLRLRI